MPFPAQAPVKKLNRQHDEFSDYSRAYEEFGILYEGGAKFRMQAGRFLRKRPKELPDVYTVRQQNLSYTNLLSNIIGWYTSAIFKTAPQLVKKVEGATEKAAKNPKAADPKAVADIPKPVEDFCEAFEKDCDLAGTTYTDFWPQVLESLLLYRSAYALIDLPLPGEDQPASLAQQQAAGKLDPYLVFYDPTNVINWDVDSYGNLEWVVIYIRATDEEFLGDPKLVDYWYYFDRRECALYQREVKTDESALPENAVADLVPGYPRAHAMTTLDCVPVRKLTVNKGLWLANRVYLPLLNHLNLDNSLDHGLFQSNLAQLVIEDGTSGTYEEGNVPGGAVTVSEVGYHHLPNGGKMYYLEPAGQSYAASQERINNLEERIYKACYLQDQARTNRSTPTAQSGISKSMDKAPSRDAMCAYGDIIRAGMQQVYQDVLDIRGFDTIVVDVRGLDFSDKATAEDLDLLEKSTIIPMNSTTYEREVMKKNARLALPDMNPEVLAIIDDEIDSNPTPSEQEAAQQEQERQDMINKFAGSFKQADQMTA